ncbi:substrate-binding domain-containing protein, partial [Nonomuraea sp. NPDC052116]|uniref:substrate-binding domain-containing protein n=1 Tax=Nonomuraea sp. NPDC052116 TaxID=3155665 RepID=UPI00343CE0AE
RSASVSSSVMPPVFHRPQASEIAVGRFKAIFDPRNRMTAGWRAALEARGIEPPPTWAATFDPRSGYELGLELAHRDDVTAVFCATDVVAAAVLRAFRDAGVALPGGKSVAGFDDQPFSRFLSPALTTVEQDFQRLGWLAFRQLLHLRDGQSQPPDLVVRPALVVRESSARPHP